jgi:mono/diheme cytochrome c family protein
VVAWRNRRGSGLAALAVAIAVAGCGGQEGVDVANGKRLFTGEGECGTCHILQNAGTGGVLGPNLDEAFAPSRNDGLGGRTIEGVVYQQIENPRNASLMPADLVRGQDARDVAAYVAEVAGRPGDEVGGSGGPSMPLGPEPGRQIYNAAGCGSCHALSEVGTSANAGPQLNDIAIAARSRVPGVPPEQYIREAIVDPDKYLVPGFRPGVMPDDYGRRLRPAEVDALTDWLMAVGRG